MQCAMRKSWPASSSAPITPPTGRPRYPSRTGASSASPISRPRGTSPSCLRSQSRLPTRCRRQSSPTSRSIRASHSTCASANDANEGSMSRRGYEGVAVAVPVTVPYVRYSIRAAHWWLARCLADLLKASGLKKEELDGFSVSSFTLAPDTGIGLTQHLGLSPRWLDHVPFGGASGIVQLRRAARAVQSGDADVVACVAGDTNHVDSFRLTLANFSQFARDAVYPYGAGGPNASFAFLTAYYMRTYGAKREDFGKLCVAQRANALKFEHALFKKPLTLEEYLSARPIAEPLHLFDCVMPCAGADAFLVMSADRAKALGLRYARLRGTIERHNAFASDPVQMRAGWALDRADLYEQAGAAPTDLDFVQTYDDYPVISLMQLEV